MISRFCTKTVLSFLIASLVIPSGLLFYPKKSEAAVVSCIAQIGAALGFSAATEETTRVPNSNDATSKTSTAGSFVEDCIFKPLVVRMAKALLNEMTMKTVAWINNGFKGNPGFAVDLGGLLQDTADQVIGDFLAKEAPFLCSQFSFQLRIAVAQSRLPYRQRSSCTLTKIINNVNGFVDGNNRGSWDNWIQVTTVPRNNAYGAFTIAQDELSKRIFDAQKIQETYLNWGRGFKNWEYCSKDENGFETCNIETPGSLIETRLSETLNMDLQQIGLANDLNAVYDALTNQLAKQVMGGTVGLLGGNRGPRRTTITPTNYAASAQQTNINTGTDLGSAFSTGLTTGVSEFSTQVNNPPPVTTSTGSTGGTTGPTTVGGPTGTQTLDLIIDPASSSVVSQSAPLIYEMSLVTNYETNGLFFRTAFKRGDYDYPFLQVFSSVKAEVTTYDGSKISVDLTAPAASGQATINWSDVATRDSKPFTVKITGTVKSGAPTGQYRLETVVYDVQGTTLDIDRDKYITVQ
jgi:hypothetical protein